MKKTAIFLANGCEELETVGIIDLLRRAGFSCTMIGVEGPQVLGCHGIRLEVDCLLRDGIGEYDLLVLPGGMPGAEALAACAPLLGQLYCQNARGALIGALCAAPIALAAAGILEGRRVTVYPGFESRLDGAQICSDPVVRDGNLLTGRGPGAVLPFALALVAALDGDASSLADALLI